MIIKKDKPRITGFNQELRPGQVRFVPVTINISQDLLVSVDSQLGLTKKTKRPYGRSKFICTILRQYFQKLDEKDPRFLLDERKVELANLRENFKLEESSLLAEIVRLEPLAKAKFEGLMRK